MKAVRHNDVVKKDEIDIKSNHLQHMYSGPLSWYYYKRFDMVLEQARIETSNRVLIMGGGTGIFTLSLVELFSEIYFVDFDKDKIDDARELLGAANIDDSTVNFIAADGTRLPVADDSIDIVFALDTLEHIPDAQTAVSESRRILHENGQFLVSAPIEVGPPLAVREMYRFFDGQRQKSTSISELIRSIAGRPPIVNPTGHRGYDFRETIDQCKDNFEQVKTKYCPVPLVKWGNPTAIINAQFEKNQ